MVLVSSILGCGNVDSFSRSLKFSLTLANIARNCGWNFVAGLPVLFNSWNSRQGKTWRQTSAERYQMQLGCYVSFRSLILVWRGDRRVCRDITLSMKDRYLSFLKLAPKSQLTYFATKVFLHGGKQQRNADDSTFSVIRPANNLPNYSLHHIRVYTFHPLIMLHTHVWIILKPHLYSSSSRHVRTIVVALPGLYCLCATITREQ